jgi:hypothetical protein
MNENLKIIKVKKNKDGDITDVMLENKSVVPLNHAIMMAKDGKINGVIVVRGKDGGEFLSVDPYGVSSDSLNNLPGFR